MPPNRSLSARLHTWRGAALAVALVVAGLSLLLPGSSPRAADEKNAPLPSPPSDEGEGKVRGKPPTQYECRWADGPITLDGKADEAAWKNAQVIDHFYLPWLGKNARKARTATKARLLWDREYLYFHAEMEDSDLYADVKEHDGPTWDTVRVVIRHEDDQGQLLRYSQEAVTLATEGPIELVGPATVALVGGSRAVWVRSLPEAGTGALVVRSPRFGDQSVSIRVTCGPEDPSSFRQ